MPKSTVGKGAAKHKRIVNTIRKGSEAKVPWIVDKTEVLARKNVRNMPVRNPDNYNICKINSDI